MLDGAGSRGCPPVTRAEHERVKRLLIYASSAESVGRLRLWQFPRLMISGGFQRFIRLEAVGLFDCQFRFVVHPCDTAIHNGSTILEPIQPYLARGQDALLDFPRGFD